jgi:hypothetical protein
MIGYKFKRAFGEIEKKNLPEFVKEPYPSNKVNGTKNGCQNMVHGTKFGSCFWLMNKNCLTEQKTSFIFG